MKRFVCAALAVMILLCASLCAFATTIYTYDDLAVELSEENGGFSVVSSVSSDTSLTIPETLGGIPVIALSEHALMKSTSIQTLTLQEPLSVIGEYACLNCTALLSVNLPLSLTTIGEAAFSGCEALTIVNLGDTSVTRVEAYTFMNTRIESITIPDSCTEICDNAFLNCTSLRTVTIPPSVVEIGESAFDGCEGVTIRCKSGTCAAEHAADHGVACEYISFLKTFLNGDADGDGEVSIMDATRIQRLLAELSCDDPEDVSIRGDVDGNGIDILDATAIRRFLAELGNPYDINTIIQL